MLYFNTSDNVAISEAEKVQKVRIEHDEGVKNYMKQKRIQARKQRQQENEEKRREQERIALNKRKVEEEAKSAVVDPKKKVKQKHLDVGKPKVKYWSDIVIFMLLARLSVESRIYKIFFHGNKLHDWLIGLYLTSNGRIGLVCRIKTMEQCHHQMQWKSCLSMVDLNLIYFQISSLVVDRIRRIEHWLRGVILVALVTVH